MDSTRAEILSQKVQSGTASKEEELELFTLLNKAMAEIESAFVSAEIEQKRAEIKNS